MISAVSLLRRLPGTAEGFADAAPRHAQFPEPADMQADPIVSVLQVIDGSDEQLVNLFDLRSHASSILDASRGLDAQFDGKVCE